MTPGALLARKDRRLMNLHHAMRQAMLALDRMLPRQAWDLLAEALRVDGADFPLRGEGAVCAWNVLAPRRRQCHHIPTGPTAHVNLNGEHRLVRLCERHRARRRANVRV